jgi:hypothetical protein
VLRRAIVAYGVLAVAGGLVLLMVGARSGLVIYFIVNGVVVLAAVLFERGRYRPAVTPGGNWQETDERFVDPTTGQLMRVRYNPQTGARDYVPAPPQEGGRQLP